jgi:radical SAM superfamily enzyme YgiQ (UPF0313 family)
MPTRDPARHPKGLRARILLSSVFGPYAQDDCFGSRAINPMELYHNQVTRVQGAFSLRMFHRSFGLLLIQANLEAPCTVLDFPTLGQFTEEIRNNRYDIIGIGAITPNIGKVAEMCRLIRRHQPQASIVIGGHIANYQELERQLDADHIVRGDGVGWFRRYLGQDAAAPVRHPAVYSAFGARILGVTLRDKPGDTAAILIPSVGCPVGCNFCSTSALFGGKGHFVNFYESGDELFDVMCRLEQELRVNSFFVLDENFLLHRKRALRLLELMRGAGKSWMLNVFSSARVLNAYSMEQLVGLGIGWVWMGLEDEHSAYRKLRDIDTRALVRRLQSHGIRVLGSTIIGLEHHRPETLAEVIGHAVSHGTDFHQFMLYTPNHGTPLHEQLRREGRLLDAAEFSPADAHGQYRFNYRHPHFVRGEEQSWLLRAFQRDFEANGPSLERLIRTLLRGWRRHRRHPEARVRARYAREVAPLRTTYAGAVWAMRRRFRHDTARRRALDELLTAICREFGPKTWLAARVFGVYAYLCLRREERRLARGMRYEPQAVRQLNAAARALTEAEHSASRALAGARPVAQHP